MDDKFQEELRAKLLEERKRVEKALSVVADKDVGDEVPGEYAPRFPNYGDDHYTELEDNSPTEVADYTVTVDSTGELESRLNDVEGALEKLDGGRNFGYCEKCGQSISPDRLRANPAARTCVNCAK